jgi:hypothetical protein
MQPLGAVVVRLVSVGPVQVHVTITCPLKPLPPVLLALFVLFPRAPPPPALRADASLPSELFAFKPPAPAPPPPAPPIPTVIPQKHHHHFQYSLPLHRQHH